MMRIENQLVELLVEFFLGFSQKVFDAYNEYFPLPEGWKEREFYKSQALEIMKKYL